VVEIPQQPIHVSGTVVTAAVVTEVMCEAPTLALVVAPELGTVSLRDSPPGFPGWDPTVGAPAIEGCNAGCNRGIP
jgi:hypothetical protein